MSLARLPEEACTAARQGEGTAVTVATTAMAAPWQGDVQAAAAAYQRQDYGHVVRLLQPWAGREPSGAEPLQLLGLALFQLGRAAEAIEHQTRATRLTPDDASAWVNLALSQETTGDSTAALHSLNRALALNDQLAAVFFNRGNVLMRLGDAAAALASFERAAQLVGPHPDLICNQAVALQKLGRHPDAAARLSTLVGQQPQLAAAWNLLGLSWFHMGAPDRAAGCYAWALAQDQSLAPAYFNASVLMATLQRFDEAIALARCASAMQAGNPDYAQHLASVRGRAELAATAPAITRTREAWEPDEAFTWNAVLSSDVQRCDWIMVDDTLARVRQLWRAGKADRIEPWRLLSLPVGGRELRERTERYVRAVFPGPASSVAVAAPAPRPARLRIGYFSSDFHNHATMTLMAGMFQAHDKTRFETVAFCFGQYGAPEDDPVRRKVRAYFDRFEVVASLSDEQIAQRARELDIHIAVDLKGHTGGNRQRVFPLRPAPIQMHHIGHPGTIGMPGVIDYLVGDSVVTPEAYREFYSEKIIELPDSYQVNDQAREIDATTSTRADHGLPEQGFVFCSFNNNYKITADVFDVWMRLLQARPGSVLWLLSRHDDAADKLRAAAAACGVDPARLVFAPRIGPARHLARHRLADLFLDTGPYNAHTTASDALWAGLPVLTCAGETFASRVGASLLKACGLPQLVTHDLDTYHQRALALSSGSPELASLRRHLSENRLKLRLFDTERFTRHIERAYDMAWERFARGLPPDHLVVPPID